MLNSLWSKQPMAQFYVVDTAKAKYLMTQGTEWNWAWGWARIVKELERRI